MIEEAHPDCYNNQETELLTARDGTERNIRELNPPLLMFRELIVLAFTAEHGLEGGGECGKEDERGGEQGSEQGGCGAALEGVEGEVVEGQ